MNKLFLLYSVWALVGLESNQDKRQSSKKNNKYTTNCCIHTVVHSCQQKSIDLKFSKPQTGSDVRYSCHHNSSRFTSPYLHISAVSLSSIHYNQSHRVYIIRRRQFKIKTLIELH